VRAGAHRGTAQFTCFTSTQVQIRTPAVRRAQELTQVSEAASRRCMAVVYSSIYCMYTYIYTYIHICTCIYIYVHTHIFIYICIFIFIYVRMYFYIHIYIHIYIYIVVVVVVCVVKIYTCAQELTHVSEAASRYMDVVTTSAPDVPAERGTQFACFTGAKVHLLTQSL
jgi:hypothetical protein